jgi:hypothetical protein
MNQGPIIGQPGPWASGYVFPGEVLPGEGGGGGGYPGYTEGVAQAGIVLAAAGAVSSIVGSYYQVSASRYQAKSAAMQLELQKTLANINARAAERDAQAQIRASYQAAGRSDLQYKQLQASARVAQNRGNLQAGVGSAAEVQASITYAKEADHVSITLNGVRAANASRLQAAGLRGQAIAAGAAASNMGLSAKIAQPWMASFQTLLGSGAQFANTWVANTRAERLYGGSQGYGGSP